MRFAIGLALGFGVGLAGAILFAPDRTKRRQVDWPAGTTEDAPPPAFQEDHTMMDSIKRVFRSVQEQINEAMEEAKKAQAEKEQELRERYEMNVGREIAEPPKLEVKVEAKQDKGKGKGKEKKAKEEKAR